MMAKPKQNETDKPKRKKDPGLSAYDQAELMKLPHDKLIPAYLDELYSNRARRRKFYGLFNKGLERDVLEKYFVDGWSASQISQHFGVAPMTVSKFLLDYIMRNYDDSRIEQIAALDSENHLGVLDSFFASVLFIARDAAMNAVVQRKLRKELAEKIAEEGVLEAVKDRDLMKAIEQTSARAERYARLSIEHLKAYLSLMEQVLDRQRDVAMVRILYDILQRLEPEVHEKLMKALEEDEYARAVLQSLPGTKLVSVFKYRQSPDEFKTKLERDAALMLEAVDKEAPGDE